MQISKRSEIAAAAMAALEAYLDGRPYQRVVEDVCADAHVLVEASRVDGVVIRTIPNETAKEFAASL